MLLDSLRSALKNNRFILTLNSFLFFALISSFTGASLTGCGFAVRSQQSFPPQLHSLYFQADKPYGQLEIALKKEMKAAGINFVDDVNQAPLTFHLATVNFGHSSDSVYGPSTQARIYHLTLETNFSITDKSGKTILEPQSVAYAHDLTLNSNEIFDTNSQVDMMKQNMQRELIIKIVNILSSQKTFKAVTNLPPATATPNVKSNSKS